MAFNPFNIFRRNQRTLFAILTVFVMFMFVLSFGQGDFFDSIPRWLGARRETGTVMAEIDGKKIYESELSKRQNSRTAANQFMARATAVANNNAYQYLTQISGQTSENAKRVVDGALMIHRAILGQEPGLNPQMINLYEQITRTSLNEILAQPNPSKDDLEAAKAAQQLMTLDQMMLLASRAEGYFINQPYKSYRDNFDFNLWLRKAEQLGINYTAEDVPSLVTREFFGRLSEADFKTLETEFLKNRQGFSRDRLQEALADEFRVRSAQTVVFGPLTAKSPNPGLQAFTTPYEAYQFFKDQCVGATYGVIDVPVANYLSKVTAQPTEAELRDLFQKHRNDEPNPSLERPGLKDPRKLKLQWLEVKGDEPFYKTAAADALAKAELQAKLAGFLIAPLGAAGAGHLAAPAAFVVGEPALSSAYEEYKQRAKFEVDINMFPLATGRHNPVGADVVQPANLVAATGAVAGSLMTGASPFTPPLVFEQRVAVEARNRRARIQAAFFANPLFGGIGVAMGSTAAALAGIPQPLPLNVVKQELLEKTKAELARKIGGEDLEKFQTELTKLGKSKDKTEAKAYIEKFVKERGLKMGGSAQFHDQFTIEQDPGLAPLKERMERGHGMMSNAQVQFGREFFNEVDPRQRREVPASTFYSPQSYPQQGPVIPGFPMPISLREGESSYLVWRTEELPAEAPKSFEAARDKVVAAWKEIKARELAQKDAEKLRDTAIEEGKQLGTRAGIVDMWLRDLHTKYVAQFKGDPAAEERARYFPLNNVTPLPIPDSRHTAFMPGRNQYEGFTMRPTKDIPHPTQQMLEDLLKNKDKPLGTAITFADAGKRNYYVGVIKDRDNYGPDYFASRVYAPDLDAELSNIVRQQNQNKEFISAREQALNLLKVEFKVDKENEKLNEKTDTSLE